MVYSPKLKNKNSNNTKTTKQIKEKQQQQTLTTTITIGCFAIGLNTPNTIFVIEVLFLIFSKVFD